MTEPEMQVCLFILVIAMFFLFGVECGFVLGWLRGRRVK